MKFPIRLFPENTKIDFIALRHFAFIVTGLMVVATIIVLFVPGLNYGTDFKGGILIEARSEQAIDTSALRKTLDGLELGSVELQEFGSNKDVLIRVGRQEGDEDAQNKAIAKVRETMGESYEYRRVEVVGPRVGEELRHAAMLALGLAMLMIGAYVAFRFEWQFGVAAVVATFHDVFVTVGLYAALGLEFDLTAVAALLTLAGYSLNDTVVVFDRIRENLRKNKNATLRSIINDATNQTLSRTMMTSLTTLLAIIPLTLFGGPALHGFSVAITWGIIVGTFSSIYVASALLLYMKPLRGIPSGLEDKTAIEKTA
ncbi:MAG: protein translocase subunit SecF [Alphaproteobacteria bacterium]|nr:protein translocase subunit SecF [Alphaproteobacteria bacterium]